MPYRLFDWRCDGCGLVREQLTWVQGKPPKRDELECPSCGHIQMHTRTLSRPALYTYDRPYAPWVAGGNFDTVGYRTPPRMPTLPNDASFDQARDLFSSAGYKEKWRERCDVIQQNKTKRARAEAMAKDPNVDLRTNPLPGDPKAS